MDIIIVWVLELSEVRQDYPIEYPGGVKIKSYMIDED